ncbi:hypothetical protein [Gracilibacillus lacisalsi]|uniref:hypothetical protein n=1 Tax=Gracilibacillus lacisalsi TaxID=393087 RepID=UPI00036A43C3|nr:hypothetical protein [Gracilibacillus lacisalsi]
MKMNSFLAVIASLFLIVSYGLFLVLMDTESSSLLFYDVVTIWLPIGVIVAIAFIATQRGPLIKDSSLLTGAFVAFVTHIFFYLVLVISRNLEHVQEFLTYYGNKRNNEVMETIVNQTWSIILQGYFTELVMMVLLGSIGGWLGSKIGRNKTESA